MVISEKLKISRVRGGRMCRLRKLTLLVCTAFSVSICVCHKSPPKNLALNSRPAKGTICKSTLPAGEGAQPSLVSLFKTALTIPSCFLPYSGLEHHALRALHALCPSCGCSRLHIHYSYTVSPSSCHVKQIS